MISTPGGPDSSTSVDGDGPERAAAAGPGDQPGGASDQVRSHGDGGRVESDGQDPVGGVIETSPDRVSSSVTTAAVVPMDLIGAFDGGRGAPGDPGAGRVPAATAPFLGATESRRLTHEQVLELYRAHHDGLLRFAVLVAPEDGMAEDLVQEAFVRLYKSWGRIRDHDKVAAYLRSTVANLARGRGRRLATAFRNRPQPPPDAASAEEGVLADERRTEVIRLLKSLPARQRECLVLRYYQGLNETEIAATLGISVGSVRTHTSRGMAALQKRIGGGA